MRGRTILALAGALAGAACVDSGLPGKNLPLEQAMQKAPPYTLYETATPTEPMAAGIAVAGRAWTGTSAHHPPLGLVPGSELPARYLSQIGAIEGAAVYALAWDESPFDHLYARLPAGEWRVFSPLR